MTGRQDLSFFPIHILFMEQAGESCDFSRLIISLEAHPLSYRARDEVKDRTAV